MERLFRRDGLSANVRIVGARLFDQSSGMDGGRLDVRIVDGFIAEIGEQLDGTGLETIDGEGLTMTPGLIYPNVHLRTPGDEDEEDIASGTRAAAAG
ncbi:MAG: dihydroorotase, partial [Gaiellales bacterium]|nr:dihydroorotase [Gaiellales bacterium]